MLCSEKVVKNGKVRGKQYYLCKNCSHIIYNNGDVVGRGGFELPPVPRP